MTTSPEKGAAEQARTVDQRYIRESRRISTRQQARTDAENRFAQYADHLNRIILDSSEIGRILDKCDDDYREEGQLRFSKLTSFISKAIMVADGQEPMPDFVEKVDEDLLVIDESDKGFLGRGSFGEVRKGTLVGTPVAVKILRKDKDLDDEEIIEEANKVKEIRHPNVVRYIGAFCSKDGEVKIVTDLCDGDMDHVQAMRANPKVFVTKAVKWFCEAARGLAFMHDVKKMVHRDIKPANILLKNDTALITDFGFALTKDEMEGATPKGTPIYAAPELWCGNNEFPVDVYAFGMTMFAILAGVDPGAKYKKVADIRHDVVKNEARPGLDEIKIEYPPSLGVLIDECWAQDPKKRPDMKTIYERLKVIYLETILPHSITATRGHSPAFDFWMSRFGDELTDSVPLFRIINSIPSGSKLRVQQNLMFLLQTTNLSDRISLKTINDMFNWYSSFGTWYDEPVLAKICGMIDENSWFVRYMDRHGASDRIFAQWESYRSHPPACFLVRCSKTDSFNSPFTFTYHDKNGIHHERIFREGNMFVCRNIDPHLRERDIFTFVDKLCFKRKHPLQGYTGDFEPNDY